MFGCSVIVLVCCEFPLMYVNGIGDFVVFFTISFIFKTHGIIGVVDVVDVLLMLLI